MIEPRREVLFGWGMANHARSLVYRPRGVEEVAEAVVDARRRGLTIVHRGAGQSYGDAALNQGGATVLTTRLNRILDYDPERGVVRAQAGVTIDRLWRHVIADGWWPPVAPGTSRATLGGCFAMNVHGKNHVQAGSFGEHVRSVTVMGPMGEVDIHKAGTESFDRHVGAQGLYGTILELELELEKVHSGHLRVEAEYGPNLGAMMDGLDRLTEEHDYSVGWIDAFATGTALGCGELHGASHLLGGHWPADTGLTIEAQSPSSRAKGVQPRSRIQTLLRLLACDRGIRGLNAAKSLHARIRHPSSYFEPHARFHFLLDYVPNWKAAYGTHGLIQYQFFVPAEPAQTVFREALELQRRRGMISWLAVLKRHRSDPYPSNYSVDGYSLALDFLVDTDRLDTLKALVADFDAMQREVEGRVYAAKDAVSQLGWVSREPTDEPEATWSSNLIRRWTSPSRHPFLADNSL